MFQERLGWQVLVLASGGEPQICRLLHWTTLGMPGLTFLLLCVSLQIYLSVKSVKSMFYILQYEGLFHKLLELLGVNDGACWKCLCVLVN